MTDRLDEVADSCLRLFMHAKPGTPERPLHRHLADTLAQLIDYTKRSGHASQINRMAADRLKELVDRDGHPTVSHIGGKQAA
jgi:YD repeat-containing protein